MASTPGIEYLRGYTKKCGCGQRLPTNAKSLCELCESDRLRGERAQIHARACGKEWWVLVPDKNDHLRFECRTCRWGRPIEHFEREAAHEPTEARCCNVGGGCASAIEFWGRGCYPEEVLKTELERMRKDFHERYPTTGASEEHPAGRLSVYF